MMTNSKINILGTEYTIISKKYDEDEIFSQESCDEYCSGLDHRIIVCDMSTYKGWEDKPRSLAEERQKCSLRHGILYAFLHESGFPADRSWLRNDQMLDWFVLQSPKIFKAWQEVGAV